MPNEKPEKLHIFEDTREEARSQARIAKFEDENINTFRNIQSANHYFPINKDGDKDAKMDS